MSHNLLQAWIMIVWCRYRRERPLRLRPERATTRDEHLPKVSTTPPRVALPPVGTAVKVTALHVAIPADADLPESATLLPTVFVLSAVRNWSVARLTVYPLVASIMLIVFVVQPRPAPSAVFLPVSYNALATDYIPSG